MGDGHVQLFAAEVDAPGKQQHRAEVADQHGRVDVLRQADARRTAQPSGLCSERYGLQERCVFARRGGVQQLTLSSLLAQREPTHCDDTSSVDASGAGGNHGSCSGSTNNPTTACNATSHHSQHCAAGGNRGRQRHSTRRVLLRARWQ
jgi:hypothetical protein